LHVVQVVLTDFGQVEEKVSERDASLRLALPFEPLQADMQGEGAPG
jgi:hypothetical protein